MITPRKTRIPYLDFLKFFAIASVLLGHSVEQTTGNDFWDNPIWSFIYTYHMPLFMLLCGYFFGSSLNLSFGELVKKKFVQLVIPSLSAFAIMYAFVTLTGYNPCPELMDFSWFGFFNAVWFLKCVFFCYLIGYISLKSLRSFWAAALVSIVLFTILPIGNVDNINFMLPMFWLGYFCQKEQEVIDRHRCRLLIASLVAFAALLPFWSGRLTVYMVPIQVVDWTNGTVDWTTLAKSAKFAFIRVGYRGYTDGALHADKMAKENLKAARKAGVPVGVYFFSQATTEKEAQEEARFVLEAVRFAKVELPLIIDYEYGYNAAGEHAGRLYDANVSKKDTTRLLTAFCDTVTADGYTAGVYANAHFYISKFDATSLPKGTLRWVADYNSAVTYTGDFDIWQYSKTGKIKGNGSKYIDLNRWYLGGS